MRIPQPEGASGSLKWIQIAVESAPACIQPPGLKTVEWLSPLRSDDFAEYRDASFLKLLGLAELAPALASFWPSRGPQWDALGVADGAAVILEAKAHIDEFHSDASQASGDSLSLIGSSLSKVATALGAGKHADLWPRLYYQYANRLAHLEFLRRHGVDAHLVFVNFINDSERNGPDTIEQWDIAYRAAHYALGLGARHPLSRYVHHMHPDVRELAKVVS